MHRVAQCTHCQCACHAGHSQYWYVRRCQAVEADRKVRCSVQPGSCICRNQRSCGSLPYREIGGTDPHAMRVAVRVRRERHAIFGQREVGRWKLRAVRLERLVENDVVGLVPHPRRCYVVLLCHHMHEAADGDERHTANYAQHWDMRRPLGGVFWREVDVGVQRQFSLFLCCSAYVVHRHRGLNMVRHQPTFGQQHQQKHAAAHGGGAGEASPLDGEDCERPI
mmetsp:Transcript_6787/g.16601  ORF Transcript_6787/g.16601 Transcript_6787/m.16601 type:complete len:223 (+) Transcript_6787:5227-5895(+)